MEELQVLEKKKLKRSTIKYTGIYGIFNEVEKKAYIGQSICTKTRMRGHKWSLSSNRYAHNSLKLLQEDWNRDSSLFEFRHIEFCEEHELLSLETDKCLELSRSGWELYNTFLVTDVTGMFCPELYRPVVERIIRMLDKGRISLDQLNAGLDSL